MQNLGEVMKSMMVRVQQLHKDAAGASVPAKIHQCPTCKDQEGWFQQVVDDENGKTYEVWIDCQCYRRRQATQLLASSRITPEFWNKAFTHFQTDGLASCIREAFDAAVEYVQAFDRIRSSEQNSLALLGRSGSGKTHLLMAVANRLNDAGVGVLYFPWVEGFDDLKRNFDVLPRKIHMLKTADVLFIDDLFKGRERPTPFQLEQLFAVVNYRYLNHLPMLISSERDIDRLCDPEVGDEAIGTRIYERCRDYLVIMTGNVNYRLNGV